MIITSFDAVDYRNIENAHLEFGEGINLLYGQNAQGKTNILEGIYTFARGKSFRAASDSEQVRFGTRGFSLSLGFRDRERAQTLSYRYKHGSRERMRNGASVSLVRDMMGVFRAVLFTPEHLSLVKGGPGERRLFMNVGISQLKPAYVGLLARYNTVLEHRNRLLKDAAKSGVLDREQIEVFNTAMASLCADISLYRALYIAAVGQVAAREMKEISGGREEIVLQYEPSVPIDVTPDINGRPFDALFSFDEAKKAALCAAYEEILSSRLDREVAVGYSLFGINHDDIGIRINGKDARSFASQGQQRSTVLSLKIAEGEVSFRESGEYPVFLLDDVLSELDGARREYLLSSMGERQVILTACESYGIEKISAHVFTVEEGRYGPAYR